MRIGHHFGAVSGLGNDDVAILAHRFDEEAGLEPEYMESWLVSLRRGRMETQLTVAGWINGVWVSPHGALWATHADGRLLWRGSGGGEWRPTVFPGALAGVWGVDDANVFVWGSERGSPFISRWDGTQFSTEPMRAQVLAMHGTQPGLVMAVGADGLAARWDGARWHEVEVPTTRALWSVFVADEELVYACGPRAMLLSGTVRELASLPDPAFPPRCVFLHHDTVWVGCGELGLHAYRDRATSARHFDVHAETALVNGGQLTVQGPQSIWTTDDLVRLRDTSTASFVELSADQPPLFAPFDEEPAEQDDDDDDAFELPDPPLDD